MDYMIRAFELPNPKLKTDFAQLRRAIRDDYSRDLTKDDRQALLVFYHTIVENIAKQSSDKERRKLIKIVSRDERFFQRARKASFLSKFAW